ncbi:MAG: crossover junction endodeoxyribonuclease RuvC [Baekduia sp.]
MRVLGIDPGIANTGFGVVDLCAGRPSAVAAGVIETASADALESRLACLHRDLEELFAEFGPAAVALEELYFGQNASSAMAVGQARGVVLLSAGIRGIPASGYTPQQIKQSVCGSGRAAKEQVIEMVRTRLSLTDRPLPDHAADALAAALCHVDRAPLARALEFAG